MLSLRSAAGVSPAALGSASWRPYVAGVRDSLRLAMRAAVTRQGLKELDNRALADIGLSRTEAELEAHRAPWSFQVTRRKPAAPLHSASVSSSRGNGRAGPNAPSWQPEINGGWQYARQWVAEALRRRRSRQAITDLDAWILKDIGVSYAEAEYEANKPFWR